MYRFSTRKLPRWLGAAVAGFTLTAFFMTGVAQAAKPEVICAEEVLLINKDTNRLLAVGNTKKRIEQAVAEKLAAADKAGKLPFAIKKASSYEYEGVMTDVEQEIPVALIPLAVMSDSLDSRYQVQEKNLYKSVVVGSLYFAICKGGSTANNWTMVGAVPVSGYDPISLGGDINHPLLTPPTDAQTADVYASMMEKLIRENLNFADLAPYLKNISKPADNTYEVVAVDMTAKRADAIFGKQKEAARALLGSFYSNKFQEISKKVVYPPITMIGKNKAGKDMSAAGNQSAADDVSDSIYSLAGGYSTSGATMTLSVPEPNHKIYLNFSGAAWQELPDKKGSLAVKNIGYKAWLRSHIDSKPERVESDVKSVQYLIPPSGSTAELEQEQLPDIYTELLVRLADKLATTEK